MGRGGAGGRGEEGAKERGRPGDWTSSPVRENTALSPQPEWTVVVVNGGVCRSQVLQISGPDLQIPQAHSFKKLCDDEP